MVLLTLAFDRGEAESAAAETAGAPEGFRETLNSLREERGSQPLRLSPSLTRATQTLLEKLLDSGELEDPARSGEAVAATLAAAGYEAQAFVEAMAHSNGEPQLILERWAVDSPHTLEPLLADDFRDLGVGIVEVAGRPLYYLVVALSIDDYYATIAAELEDLTSVRSELLRLVNEERRQRGLTPLRLQHQLNFAAQSYAEDMLARDFYGHESPEGTTVMDRARAAGYRGRMTGENLANGVESVDLVMQEWMKSEGHRKNILSRRFREVGFGVAIGKKSDGYRIIWVQCFGRPPG